MSMKMSPERGAYTRCPGPKVISLAALMLFLLVTTAVQPVVAYMVDHLSWLSFNVSWAVVKIALLAVGLLFGASSLLATLGRGLSLAGALLLVWVILIQAIQAPALLATFPEETLTVLGNTFLTSAGLWLVGSNFAPLFALLKRSRAWKCILWLLYGGFAFIVGWGTAVGFAQSGRFVGLYQNPYVRAGYLQIADTFILLTFLVAAVAERKATRTTVLLLGSVLLFAALSRASFLFYWLTLGLRVLLVPGRRRLVRATLLLLVAVVAAMTVYILPEPWESYRMLQFLKAPLADQSVQLRLEQFSDGFARLGGHWLFGIFMAEVTQGAGMGTYMHNWLSFWDAYGLGPFLFSCALIAATVWGAVRVFRQREVTNAQLFAAYVGIFCFFSVAVARAYIWPYVWLSIGTLPILWPRMVVAKQVQERNSGAQCARLPR